jgi:excinuclease UvrABC nuclease subunit
MGPPRAAVPRLPNGPGVYRFRDGAGRVLYIGRAGSLRRRVGSYWGDLGDRPHLARMVAQIGRVEAVCCASQPEAAWLERLLLERSIPRWNRALGGQEVEVYIRLSASPRSPGLSVVHDLPGRPGDGLRYFGPYLGGARVRLAVAGLHRVFPLAYTADAPAGTAAAMAAERGVRGADRAGLASQIAAVLDRDPAAVSDACSRLVARRDAAAAAEAFEAAGRVQAELAALDWVTSPQRLATLGGEDADVAGWAGGLLVRFEVAAGRMCGWRQYQRTRAQAEQWLAKTPPHWREFAAENAALAASLSAAVGPAGEQPELTASAG